MQDPLPEFLKNNFKNPLFYYIYTISILYLSVTIKKKKKKKNDEIQTNFIK